MKQVIQRLIDDLDPSHETDAAETVRFALDGDDYEIDLSEENATALREALAGFVAAATKVTKSANGYKRTGTSKGGRQRNAAIRQWAQEQGMEMSARGRIQNDIVKAYEVRVERTGSAELVKGDGAKPTKREDRAITATSSGAARRKAAKGAEKATEAPPKPDPHQGTPAQRRELSKAVRAYWSKHRRNVPAKGKMPPEVWKAYEQQDSSLLPASK